MIVGKDLCSFRCAFDSLPFPFYLSVLGLCPSICTLQMKRSVFLLLCVVVAACAVTLVSGECQCSAGPTASPRKAAPTFTGTAVMPDESFSDVSLQDYEGKWLVMFFFPFAFTVRIFDSLHSLRPPFSFAFHVVLQFEFVKLIAERRSRHTFSLDHPTLLYIPSLLLVLL